MKSIRIFLASLLSLAFIGAGNAPSASFEVAAQSRRQAPTQPQKKNQRRGDDAQQQSGEEVPTDVVGKPEDAEVVRVQTRLVNVDAVVYNKKSGQIVLGLKRENFAIFEDGVRQDITFFSTPEAPITVSLLLEYSRLTEALGGDRFESGKYEVVRPTALFLSQFVRPPNDFVSVVAYDVRPTPLTDFTNDPQRLQQVITLLLRNNPVYSEANLFDALKLVLAGGRADSVVLEDNKERQTEYAGLGALQGRRRAVILISSGIDTFSKINYDQARKIVQNTGVPVYIIGTGEMYRKLYDQQMDAMDGPLGSTQPGRLSLLQAQNTLRTFAKDSGGAYFPVTFQTELPSVLNSINAFLRNQYSLGYSPVERRDGKQRKLLVKVDVDGDGQFDEKEFVVHSRQFYTEPKPDGTNGKKGE